MNKMDCNRMMDPKEIVNTGKRLVVNQLKNNGWNQVMVDENVPPPVDVIAVHKNKKLLISVTPTIQPKEADNIDSHRADQLRSMAAQNNADPYQVKVQLTPNLTGASKVSWLKL
jgi:hypothetical protein